MAECLESADAAAPVNPTAGTRGLQLDLEHRHLPDQIMGRSDHGPIRSLADQIIGEAAEVEVEPRMRPVVGEEFKTPIDRDVVVEVVIAQRVDRKAVSKVAVIVHHEVAVHVIDLKRSTDLDRFEPVQVPGSRSVSRQLSNKSEV